MVKVPRVIETDMCTYKPFLGTGSAHRCAVCLGGCVHYGTANLLDLTDEEVEDLEFLAWRPTLGTRGWDLPTLATYCLKALYIKQGAYE